MKRFCLFLLAIFMLATFPSVALARALERVAPKFSCASLAGFETQVEGARANVASASLVATAGTPRYCEVKGQVEPRVQFELHLPVDGWQQRLLFTGCGGFCGSVRIRIGVAEGCPAITDGTMATVSSDLGHSAAFDDTSWASGNPQARLDYGHRANHVVTLAAKAIIDHFYMRPPVYSYFSGCSDGGREAMMEAQRYPDDFDGIIAGAPVINVTANNSVYHAWIVQHLLTREGKPVFSDAQLGAVHDAVLARCDARDGKRDGILAAPLACRFDPNAMRCTPARASDCLTGPQASAIAALYKGPVGRDGRALYFGMPLGSETTWNMSAQGSLRFARSFMSYMTSDTFEAMQDVWATTYATADLARYYRFNAVMNATDPDLRPFLHSGGKLILWHGWNDASVPPGSTLAYAKQVRAQLGRAADAGIRLYMLPGVNHCGGGDGPDKLDLLSAMIAWVEDGKAPGAVAARHGEEAPWRIAPYRW